MIFIDSSFLIGLLLKKDNNHKRAKKLNEIIKQTNETTVINNVVLDETLNKVSKKIALPPKLLIDLINNNKMIYLSENDYKKSFEINQKINNAINYNDCCILNTMMSHQIDKIASFDEDFDKIKGIRRISLPKNY